MQEYNFKDRVNSFVNILAGGIIFQQVIPEG